MRIVELSNHPAEMRRSAQATRDAQAAQAKRDYEALLAEHGARLAGLRAERDQARSAHRWLRFLGRALAIWREKEVAPSPPVLPAPSARELAEQAKVGAGIEGEQLVAEHLGQVLGDEWTLFRGYKNRAGEIDHLLLGPQGLIAIEVKHRNARVSCLSNGWWFEKFDRYGNLVEEGPLTDRAGRSPSQQLLEPAQELVEFLRSRGQSVDAHTAILLTHPRSELGTRSEGLPVNLISPSISSVPETFINGRDAVLDGQRCAELARLIERDHRFHEQRRHRRGGRGRGR